MTFYAMPNTEYACSGKQTLSKSDEISKSATPQGEKKGKNIES